MVPDLRHRGRLQKGAIADITTFDPKTVIDNADWKEGMNSLPSTGIPYVVVNGTVVKRIEAHILVSFLAYCLTSLQPKDDAR